MKGELSIKVIRGQTGRTGYHLRNDSPTAHLEVQAFAIDLCNQLTPNWDYILSSNKTAQQIKEDISKVKQQGLIGYYYRARSFPILTKPEPNKFGAPPLGKQSEGRYNESAVRVLYLAKDSQTAIKECSPSPEEPSIWVQKFNLQLPNDWVINLDLDMEEKAPYLHYLLLDSEYIPNNLAEFPNIQNLYRATHLLKYICKLLDVSAIEYPSIKGDIQNNPSAINLVVIGDVVLKAEAMTTDKPQLSSLPAT